MLKWVEHFKVQFYLETIKMCNFRKNSFFSSFWKIYWSFQRKDEITKRKCPGNRWIFLERCIAKPAFYHPPRTCNNVRFVVIIIEKTVKLETFHTRREIRVAFYDSAVFKMLKNIVHVLSMAFWCTRNVSFVGKAKLILRLTFFNTS